MSTAVATDVAGLLRDGLAALDARDLRSAIRLIDHAQAAGAEEAECAAARWQAWMLLGECERAWSESDRIESLGVVDPHRFHDGRPLAGRRVILRCLHGFGDAIQFIRYAPMLRKVVAQLTIEVPPKLFELFREQSGWGEVVTWGEQAPAEEPEWDAQVEIMELPRLFRIAPAELPVQFPYLRTTRYGPEARLVFAHHGDGPKVGLCWAASEWDPQRSLYLDMLAPLLDVLPERVYSVQWGKERNDIAALGLSNRMIDTASTLGSIAQAAAVIDQLDLVITVDGMVAHLAGALGKPVWLLLPFAADWRWGSEPSRTPWYPRMRIFRQQRRGEWSEVIAAVHRRYLSEMHVAETP